MYLVVQGSALLVVCSKHACIPHNRSVNRRFVRTLANVYAQTIAAFEESNRMYAIPAETAAQGEPFQKENLPGPGK